MLGIVYHWDPKNGLDERARRQLFQMFDYTCRSFCADKVVVVDKEGGCDLSLPTGVSLSRDVDAALAQFDNMIPVYVSRGPTSVRLQDFVHPENAVYVIGGDYCGLEVPTAAACVQIKYNATAMELWASVALGIVLYDRSVRG